MTRRDLRAPTAVRYAWLRADRAVWRATKYPLGGWIGMLLIIALMKWLGWV